MRRMKRRRDLDCHAKTPWCRTARHLAIGCGALALGAAAGCGSDGGGNGATRGSGSSGSSGGSGGSSGSAIDSGADPYAGCTWDVGSGTQMAGPPPTQDNAADLRGDPVGTHPFDPNLERRSVTVNLTSPLPGLQVGQAYVTRLTATDETAYLTIPVTNTGTEYPCFVSTNPYRWLDATGQLLNMTKTEYLYGSVGVLSGALYSETCLGPGERGYFLGIESAAGGAPLYSAVVSIDLGLSSSTAGTAPPAKVVPTRYDLGTCAGTRTLRVEGAVSGATVAIGGTSSSLGTGFFLDANGLPAGWLFVSQKQPANIAPGTTALFYDNLIFVPALSRLQFFLPFEPQNMFMSLPSSMLHTMEEIHAARVADTRLWQTATDRMAKTFAP
jgi:hypothetical protein